jgi:hypothetical protein
LRTPFHLPQPNSKCIGSVRLDMLVRGFSLVSTPSFFDDDLFPRLTRRKTVLSYHAKRWWKYPQLARYACWLERLLNGALPEEHLALAYLEFRNEPAGYTEFIVDRLHVDGSYIRSVCTLDGPTTIYQDGSEERSVPQGQTLLMTAIERSRVLDIPGTLHCRPGAGPERTVIVCSFEPRPEQPQLASLSRHAAQPQRVRQAAPA